MNWASSFYATAHTRHGLRRTAPIHSPACTRIERSNVLWYCSTTKVINTRNGVELRDAISTA
jgi:hypothetical protein